MKARSRTDAETLRHFAWGCGSLGETRRQLVIAADAAPAHGVDPAEYVGALSILVAWEHEHGPDAALRFRAWADSLAAPWDPAGNGRVR